MPFVLAALLLGLAPTPVADLTAAVDQYRAAIVKGDRAALATLMHDDFVLHGDGQYRDKAAEIADLVADGFTVHEFRLDEPRYRVIAGTGIATGILRWSMTFNGRQSTAERRTTMTWVKNGERWQMAAQHVARMK